MDLYRNKIITFGIKCYLQVLFTIGAFLSKPTWVDKHIKVCYNRLDKIKGENGRNSR